MFFEILLIFMVNHENNFTLTYKNYGSQVLSYYQQLKSCSNADKLIIIFKKIGVMPTTVTKWKPTNISIKNNIRS